MALVRYDERGAEAFSAARHLTDDGLSGWKLATASMDAAWLSTVVHHIPDLPAAARELRRVLRPGAPVLIRSAFAGRHQGLTLFAYFPEAITVLGNLFPSVLAVQAAFARAGFSVANLESVPQQTAPSLHHALATFRRDAHTPLQLIDDAAYERGLARLREEAARTPDRPVVDRFDVLVLR